MKLRHATATDRAGKLEKTTSPAGQVALLFERTDDKGKTRKKTFKKKVNKAFPSLALESLWSTALRTMFKEGFVAPAPQKKGPLRWLTVTEEPYPHGFPFDIDREGGFV